jgi:hypothetical protein
MAASAATAAGRGRARRLRKIAFALDGPYRKRGKLLLQLGAVARRAMCLVAAIHNGLKAFFAGLAYVFIDRHRPIIAADYGHEHIAVAERLIS